MDLDLELLQVQVAKSSSLVRSTHMGMVSVCHSDPFFLCHSMVDQFLLCWKHLFSICLNALNWIIKLWCKGVAPSDLHQLWSADHMHLFPILLSVMSHWQLEISHNAYLY